MKNSLKVAFENMRLYSRFACRKLGVPGFKIHQIYLPRQSLLYIPIPKNACTSIKHALYEIEFGERFSPAFRDRNGYNDHHDYYKKRAHAFTSVRKLQEMEQVTRFAVVRDPVKRLLSCYRNRVLDLGDLQMSKHKLKQMGLPLKPDINTFILNLNRYRRVNKLIAHHSRPQSYYLGGSVDYLDYLFSIEQMDNLQQMLQDYKPDLEILQRKSGGTDISLEEVSKEAFEAALTMYHQDYELLQPLYSPQKLREHYELLTS